MRIVRSIDAVGDRDRGSHAAIGNFDGVHRGHQAVIGSVLAGARAAGELASVITFEPHPRDFFGRGTEPFRLTPAEVKERRLQALGVDRLFVFAFDASLAGLPAEGFARDVLGGALGLRSVSAGADFRFGRGRAGDVALLRDCGAACGYEVHEVGKAGEGGEAFSSSAIRAALRAGDPQAAARQLGGWHRIEGVVERGDGRGRGLGMATANLPLGGVCLPAFGVYAVEVELCDGARTETHSGVASLGVNPTFGGSLPRLEAHLFDYEGDLYGARIAVGLCAYLRAEETFGTPEALAARMRRDAEQAREVLAGLLPPWAEAVD